MGSTTIDELQSRIQVLEAHLSKQAKSGGESVESQISSLRTQLSAIYEDNHELNTLNRIIGDLKLWNEVSGISEANLQLSNSEKDEISPEMKKELILLNYPVVMEAYKNLTELANMDVSKLINNVESTNGKIDDLAEGSSYIALRKEQLQLIVEEYHKLVVKNIIVFEKYTSLMQRENEFWLQASQRVRELNRKIASLEKTAVEESKY